MRYPQGALLPPVVVGPPAGVPNAGFPGPWPPRPGENRPGLSAFGRLAKGGNYGKSSILLYDSCASNAQPAGVDMLHLSGDDLDACQLIITLHPPRVIPLSFNDAAMRLDTQNLTGEQSNNEVSIEDFCGTCSPIAWPPLEAHVEFGVGGSSSKFCVDYLNGVTFSLSASFVRVHAAITQSPECNDICATSAAYYLGAHVGPGNAANHPTRTVHVGKLCEGNSSNIFDLPKFATRATIYGARTNDCEPPRHFEGFIRFWQSPDGTCGVGDCFVSSKHQHFCEVPNGAQYFSVVNDSGQPMKASVVFELAF